MSLELIRKEYDIFSQLYRDELQKREFEIADIRENSLIARYRGSNKFRAKDFNLEVIIKKQDGKWVLNADSRLYCNRAHLILDPEKTMQYGANTSGYPLYAPGKLLHIDYLQFGVAMPKEQHKILLPFGMWGLKGNGYLELAKYKILELLANNSELITEGFSEEELKEFKLPSSGATAHIL